MRRFLLILGWGSLLGTLGDLAITGFIAWLVFVPGVVGAGITVEDHLRGYLPALLWMKAVSLKLLPEGFVLWVFGMPALIWYPVRIVAGVAVSVWLLRIVRRMGPASLRGGAENGRI